MRRWPFLNKCPKCPASLPIANLQRSSKGVRVSTMDYHGGVAGGAEGVLLLPVGTARAFF